MYSSIQMLPSSNSVRVSKSQHWRSRLSSIPFFKHILPPPIQLQHQIGIAEKCCSETGRQLMGKRRFVGDFALALVLAGIGLMILANEFAFASIPRMEQLLRIGILACTFALILSILRYHWIELKIYRHQNNAHNWQTALNSRQRTKIIFEIFVCSICPIPGVIWPIGDPFLCSLMFLRLYWLPRCLHLHSRLSTDAAAKSIAGLNRVKTDTRFMLKRMLFLYPGLALATFVFNFWLIGAYVLRLCESDISIGTIQSYYNAIWMMCVTFLTIGYGDIYPVTSCGRLMAIMTGVVGVCVASMIVAVIVQKISLSQAEERVHNFMAKTKHARSLKMTAAQVLKESWFIYKNRQNADQDLVRHHERRLSAAICTLRKLKKEQRTLAEVDGGASLGEVAKISQNALELVQAMGNDQRNLNARINGMEYKLEEINRGIGSLTGILMRRMMTTEILNGQIEGQKKMGTKLANVQEDGE